MKKIFKSARAVLVASAFFMAAESAFSQSNSDFMFQATKSAGTFADYSAIDNYVKSLSITTDMSYESAAKKICQNARNDIEKARAIYYWLATNFTYDYNFTEPDAYMADSTWSRRTGVCQGYSELFIKLARCVGLNAEYCTGYSKSNDYTYTPSNGTALESKKHGWIVVHTGGKHILLDATWASTTNSMDTWFDVNPVMMLSSHMPRNELMTFLPQSVSLEKFKMMPRISPILTGFGIDGNELYDFLLTHSKAWAPSFYPGAEEQIKTGLKVKKMPMANALKKGQSYTFNFTFPSSTSVKIRADGKDTSVQSGKDVQITPNSTSEVIVFAGGKRICYYTVENSPSYQYQNQIAQVNAQHKPMTSTATFADAKVRQAFIQSRLYDTQKNVAGLEYTNVGKVNLTATDNSSVNNHASNGKHKVLYFAYLPYHVEELRNIVASWADLKSRNIDFYIIDIGGASKDQVSQAKNQLGAADDIKFVYSAKQNGNNSPACELLGDYHDKILSNIGNRPFGSYNMDVPAQIYIDSDNKLQMVELGITPIADQMIQNIDDYLVDHIQRKGWIRNIREDYRKPLKDKMKVQSLNDLRGNRIALQSSGLTSAFASSSAVTVTCDSSAKMSGTTAETTFTVKGNLSVSTSNIALATNTCGAKIQSVTKGSTSNGATTYTLTVSFAKAGSFSYTVSDANKKKLATSSEIKVTIASSKSKLNSIDIKKLKK